MTELGLEKLKMVYDNVAEQHRYYLSWRQYLLAGYFVVIATMFYACFYLLNKGGFYEKISFVITLVIGFLSLLFMLLDKRNRDLYHVCQRVGSKIEQELFKDLDPLSKDNKGLFFTLDKSIQNSKKWSHSCLLDILYISVSIISFIISIGLFIAKTLNLLG